MATVDFELGRYADLAKTRGCRVAILGCGAIGGATVAAMLPAGFRRVTLVDCDRVEPHNCLRGFGVLSPGDVGRLKTDAFGDYILRHAPECEVVAVNADVRDLGARFYERFDAVVCALDNTEAVLAVGEAMAGSRVPLYRAATEGFNGSVEVVANGAADGDPCLCCHRFDAPVETRSGGCGVRYLKDVAGGHTPSVQFPTAISANRLVMELVKRLERPGGDVRYYDTGDELFRFPITRDAGCPHHMTAGGVREVDLPGSVRDTTLGRLLEGRRGTALFAQSDFVVSGRCLRCGDPYPVNRPVRRLRESDMRCPVCPPGAAPDQPHEMLSTFTASQERLQGFTLYELGFRALDRLLAEDGDGLVAFVLGGDSPETVSTR
ncbi:MAG: ThiF family adenylyltransferase [Acidobacteriota bacterium]|jgi:hypothetical protein|nr:ThiF family adenylyltransferase [Acidobacteriota bacterium]